MTWATLPWLLRSTPFGITGRSTLRAGRLFCLGVPVLNAFRHHSEEHARHSAPRAQPPGHVLNAFRHHWEEHEVGKRRRLRRRRVLNAFRHHWEGHITGWVRRVG